MSDDIGFDFDIQTAGDTTTPATGYDISEIDLSSVNDSNNMLMQLVSGAGGAYSGVERTTDNSAPASRSRRERSTNAAIEQILTSNMVVRFAQNRQRLNDLERQWNELNDAFDKALEDGHITEEQHAFYTEEINRNIEETHALKTKMGESQVKITNYTSRLQANIERLDPESTRLLTKLMTVGENVVSARLTIEGVNNGEPLRHLVHGEGERYFILHPSTGEKLYIDEHANEGERESALAQIKAQIRDHEHLANSPNLPEGVLEEFINARNEWSTRAASLGNSATVEQVGELFNAILDAKGEYARYEEQLSELEEEYRLFREDLANMSEMNIQEKQEYFETRRNEIERNIRALNSTTTGYSQQIQDLLRLIEEAKDTIKQTTESIDIVDRGLSTYKDRHDQLQSLYGNWQTAWRQFLAPVANLFMDASFNRKNALEFAEDHPNHKLVKAWRDVVKDNEGRPVYRCNEDGRLYTIDEESGRQNFIEDLTEINRLRHDIFELGKMTANESPFYDSPYDNFEETVQSIADADALNRDSEALKAAKERDLERYNERLDQIRGLEITKPSLTDLQPGLVFETVASMTMSQSRVSHVKSAAPMETDRNLTDSFSSATPTTISATDKPDNDMRDPASRDATLTQGQNNN